MRPSRAVCTVARTLAWLALGVLLAFSGGMLAAALAGYERYVVTGGSMSGNIERGALLFSETVPVGQLRVGDVITYEPPRDAGTAGLLTHRIVSVKRGQAGERVFRTKGDANASRDPWSFTLPGAEQARAAVSIPYAGYPFAALGLREVRMALIGLPALLIAGAVLTGLWRDAGREARELAEAARVRREAAEQGG
jgi:signal peptidase